MTRSDFGPAITNSQYLNNNLVSTKEIKTRKSRKSQKLIKICKFKFDTLEISYLATYIVGMQLKQCARVWFSTLGFLTILTKYFTTWCIPLYLVALNKKVIKTVLRLPFYFCTASVKTKIKSSNLMHVQYILVTHGK